jgi:hypothetical protein
VTKEQEKSRKKEEKLRVAEIERQRKREDREKVSSDNDVMSCAEI